MSGDISHDSLLSFHVPYWSSDGDSEKNSPDGTANLSFSVAGGIATKRAPVIEKVATRHISHAITIRSCCVPHFVTVSLLPSDGDAV